MQKQTRWNRRTNWSIFKLQMFCCRGFASEAILEWDSDMKSILFRDKSKKNRNELRCLFSFFLCNVWVGECWGIWIWRRAVDVWWVQTLKVFWCLNNQFLSNKQSTNRISKREHNEKPQQFAIYSSASDDEWFACEIIYGWPWSLINEKAAKNLRRQ